MAMNPYKAIRLSVIPLLFTAASSGVNAQENTFADAFTPLVYSAQNTGAFFPAPVFPDFDHLPIVRPLPDPFQRMDGGRDASFFGWERRRNEIMAAVQKYEIGPIPDASETTETATYTPPAAGSNTGTLTIVITRKSNGKTLTLTSGVYIPPNAGSGPFPALIPMEIASINFGGGSFNFPPPPQPDYGSLPGTVFTGLPIATVGYVSTQVAELSFGVIDHSTDPFFVMFPELTAGTQPVGSTSNAGVYNAWTWGVNRLIDGIEMASKQSTNPLPVDLKHLAVTGCSFAGKMALFAGAFDERIALTISQENGGGGAPSWRVSQQIEADGSVEDIHDTSYDWFGQQMLQFTENNAYKLPEDHDQLMAMVAPRALLETGNTDFYWLSNRSNYVSARATQRIYNTLGIGDRFGFYIDGGHPHCGTLPAEAPAISAFVNKFMLGNWTANTDVEVNPYPNLDYARWTWWWGKDDPRFPDDWNPGDGTVVMSLIGQSNGHDGDGNGVFGDDDGHGNGQGEGNRLLDVQAGATILGGYALSLPSGNPAATAVVAGANVQVDVVSRDGRSYTLTIPMPGASYSFPANFNSWLPTADPKAAAGYEGSATAGSFGGKVVDAYFSAIGTTTGIGNPGGPGVQNDTTSPTNVKFHINDATLDAGGHWSPTVSVSAP